MRGTFAADYGEQMSSPTRWAGVPLADRRAERRAALIAAAFDIFGGVGAEAELSVRSVCRYCGYNTRYFYESFADTDELLGAVYDRVAAVRCCWRVTSMGPPVPRRSVAPSSQFSSRLNAGRTPS